MKEEYFIKKIVKITEERFSCLAWGFREYNGNGTFIFWMICIDDWNLYSSKEFKDFSKDIRQKYRMKVIFAYCSPKEDKLLKLADADNLIMNLL